MSKAEVRAFVAYPNKKMDSLPIFYREAFIRGYEQAVKDMMADAISGEITNVNSHFNDIELPTDEFREATAPFKDGDKVKLIIVKEHQH